MAPPLAAGLPTAYLGESAGTTGGAVGRAENTKVSCSADQPILSQLAVAITGQGGAVVVWARWVMWAQLESDSKRAASYPFQKGLLQSGGFTCVQNVFGQDQ